MTTVLDSLHRLKRKKEEGAEEAVDGIIWGVRRHVMIDVIISC